MHSKSINKNVLNLILPLNLLKMYIVSHPDLFLSNSAILIPSLFNTLYY